MLSRFWEGFTNIDSDETIRVKRGLYVILITGLFAASVTTIISVVSNYYTVYGATFLAVLVVAALLVMTVRNQLTIPRLATPILGLLIAFYITQGADGVRDEAMFLYPLTIVLAGILIGKTGVIVFTVLSLAAIANQALNEISGVFVTHMSSFTTVQTLLMLSVLLSFTGLLLYMTIANLRGSLLNARANEKKFADSNRELQAIRNSLEERVNARTAQLQASTEVGQAAASTLNPEELLRTVTRLITDRFGFYYAAFFIIDPTGHYAVLREATGEAGRELLERRHQLEMGGESMVSSAILNRRPRIALDVSAETQRFANPLLPNTRSEIALPLLVGDRALGALDVQSTETGVFDESNAAVLQNMTDQIAVALSNAEQFKQTGTALQQAESLSEAIRGLVDASSLQEIIQRLARYANTLVASNRTAVYMVDHDQKQVTVQATAGDNYDPDLLKYDALAAGISGQVLRSGQPVLSLSADDGIEPAETAERRRQNGTGALIVAPLVAQGQVVGTVTVSNLIGQRLFTQADVDLLMTLAAQSVSVIERLRLFEQAQRALSDLDVINRRLTGESWNAAVRQKPGGVLWISLDDRSDRRSLPEVNQALASGQIATRSIDDGQQLGVAIPIILRDVAIGVLRLAMPRTAWNSEVSVTLEAIAGHAAQAAENARLLAVTEERFARERILGEATDRIRRKADIEQILQTAAEELARHLQASQVAVNIQPQISTASSVPVDGRRQER
jgi:GAF domain-containing protein